MNEIDTWLGIELRHIAALDAVADEGSFSRAAARLGYTQSAVSHQIATLERIVGQRLIERPGGPRGVSLTEAGRLVLRHAEAIVARLHAAAADVAALERGEAGTLRIGTYQSIGARVLPDLIRRFSASWPRVEIHLSEYSDDDESLALVERGEIELAFVLLPLEEGPFDAIELLRDPYVLVVEDDSPLARRGKPSSLEEIAELPLIGHRDSSCQRRLEANLRARTVVPRVVFRSNDNGTVQGLVAAGVGSALIPLLTVDGEDKRVAVLDLSELVPPRIIGIAWHSDRYRPSAALAFIEEATRFCAELDLVVSTSRERKSRSHVGSRESVLVISEGEVAKNARPAAASTRTTKKR